MHPYRPDIDLSQQEVYRERVQHNADVLVTLLREVAADVPALQDRYTYRVVDRERGYAGIGADIEFYGVEPSRVDDAADAAEADAVVETWLAPDRIERAVQGEDALERVVEDVLEHERYVNWSRRPETVL